ncbi:MAG TPA: ABC transporter permease [Bryobacteraceae bacterium]|nr:ABC transporter permease [Bryobacteraceae bacterium]
MLHDLRFGLRMIRRNRTFALAAILTLALGIGAATLIFSVGASLLDPFPYRDAGRIVRFYYHSLRPNGFSGAAEFLPDEFRDFRAAAHSFEGLIGFQQAALELVHDGGAEQIPAAWVTTNTFAFLGVAPLVGRPIVAEDANPAAPAVCVVSYRFWQERLHGDPAAIGRTLTFDGQPRILAGVMPPRFAFLDVPVWLPFRTASGASGNRYARALQPMARLKPGVSLPAATAELDGIEHQLARRYPEDFPDPRFTVSLRTLTDSVVGGLRPLLYSLFAAVAMLLLIASSNAANLLLARASAREREIAIRAASGATRGRLARQLLVESGILAAAAGALGCLLAAFALVGLRKLLPPGAVPAEAVFGLDQRALCFAVAVTAVTTLLCGLAPALHAARAQFVPRAFSAPRSARLRGALVIAEAALSVVLLTGAGLMIRTFFALTHVELGFDAANTLRARVALPRGYSDAQREAFSRQVLEAVGGLPGVTSAAIAVETPGLTGGPKVDFDVAGAVHSGRWSTLLSLCNETYFQTMHRRVRQGRSFSRGDVAAGAHVAIMNQTFARAYLGGRDPLGRRLIFHLPRGNLDHPERPVLNGETPAPPAREPEFEVIGVVGDARNAGVREAVVPQVYIPFGTPAGLVVRTAVPPLALVESIRRRLWAIDPSAMLMDVGTVEEAIDDSAYAQPRFALFSIGGFAAIGLLLVATGVFGVMAYQTSLRTREIGIRMALGAQPAGVFAMVLAGGLRLIAAGVAIGMAGSLALTRLLASQLWGVSPFDPASFAAAALVLAASGMAACYLPARRAARLDPIEALRCE